MINLEKSEKSFLPGRRINDLQVFLRRWQDGGRLPWYRVGTGLVQDSWFSESHMDLFKRPDALL